MCFTHITPGHWTCLGLFRYHFNSLWRMQHCNHFGSSANLEKKNQWESHSEGIKIGRMDDAAGFKSAQKGEKPKRGCHRGNFEFYHRKFWPLVTSWWCLSMIWAWIEPAQQTEAILKHQTLTIVPRLSLYDATTLKFLIVAAAFIRMKKIIFQCPMPKVHLRLLFEVLPEKLNHRAAINLNCRYPNPSCPMLI